jgi:hypothetical protein
VTAAPVPNARKGYKLTLWVTATTEAGLADVHGLLQLDGADPVPFCHLKGVQNPLARALQEAYMAVVRVRAKPPRMGAPPVVAATAAPGRRPRPLPAGAATDVSLPAGAARPVRRPSCAHCADASGARRTGLAFLGKEVHPCPNPILRTWTLTRCRTTLTTMKQAGRPSPKTAGARLLIRRRPTTRTPTPLSQHRTPPRRPESWPAMARRRPPLPRRCRLLRRQPRAGLRQRLIRLLRLPTQPDASF